MTFKWKITTPDRVTRADGVELCIPGISCEFETGSGSEAVGVFEAEDAAFTKIFGYSPIARVDFAPSGEGETGQEALMPKSEGDTAPAAGKKRGPKMKTPAPEAVAPDPIPVPPVVDPLSTISTAAAAPAGPVAAAPLPAPPPAPPIPSTVAPDVPAFLDRRPAAAAPPPPLPTVTAPPIAAAAPPPVGVLGPKVVAALDEIKKRGTDDGAALSTWLADCGLTIKGASYDDACRAVLMISDAKLTASGVVEALKVTA